METMDFGQREQFLVETFTCVISIEKAHDETGGMVVYEKINGAGLTSFSWRPCSDSVVVLSPIWLSHSGGPADRQFASLESLLTSRNRG